MSRAARRSLGKRERRRRFEARLGKVLALDREGHGPRAISDATRLEASFVEAVLEDFRRFRRAGRADEGGG